MIILPSCLTTSALKTFGDKMQPPMFLFFSDHFVHIIFSNVMKEQYRNVVSCCSRSIFHMNKISVAVSKVCYAGSPQHASSSYVSMFLPLSSPSPQIAGPPDTALSSSYFLLQSLLSPHQVYQHPVLQHPFCSLGYL